MAAVLQSDDIATLHTEDALQPDDTEASQSGTVLHIVPHTGAEV